MTVNRLELVEVFKISLYVSMFLIMLLASISIYKNINQILVVSCLDLITLGSLTSYFTTFSCMM